MPSRPDWLPATASAAAGALPKSKRRPSVIPRSGTACRPVSSPRRTCIRPRRRGGSCRSAAIPGCRPGAALHPAGFRRALRHRAPARGPARNSTCHRSGVRMARTPIAHAVGTGSARAGGAIIIGRRHHRCRSGRGDASKPGTRTTLAIGVAAVIHPPNDRRTGRDRKSGLFPCGSGTFFTAAGSTPTGCGCSLSGPCTARADPGWRRDSRRAARPTGKEPT